MQLYYQFPQKSNKMIFQSMDFWQFTTSNSTCVMQMQYISHYFSFRPTFQNWIFHKRLCDKNYFFATYSQIEENYSISKLASRSICKFNFKPAIKQMILMLLSVMSNWKLHDKVIEKVKKLLEINTLLLWIREQQQQLSIFCSNHYYLKYI